MQMHNLSKTTPAIQYFHGEYEKSRRLMLDFFGRRLYKAELYQLCGSPDTGELYIGHIGRSLYFEFYETAQWGITGAGGIARHCSTLLLTRYNYFFLRRSPENGASDNRAPNFQHFGSRMLARQAQAQRDDEVRR